MKLNSQFAKYIVALGLAFNFVGTSYAQNWMNPGKYKIESKAMKRAGKYPVSLKCRPDPAKRVFQPQLKVQWRKNSANIDWALYFYKGQLDFKPGPRAQQKKWRRISRIVLKMGAGGSTFRCSLFHKK